MEDARKKLRITSTPSQRILAVGMILAFCYWGSSVVVPLLVSILLAFFLDPFVTWLEMVHIPRALGSMVTVLVALTLIGALGWALVDRADEFGRNWPEFRAPIRRAVETVERRLETFEAGVNEIAPPQEERHVIEVTPSHPVRQVLFERLQSLYVVILGASFVPFLIFFMLATKRQVWHATMQLFPAERRMEVKQALDELSRIMRGYVVGTLFVCILLVCATWAFFWFIGLDFPFLTALVSGILNMIPYIGTVLSWLPPLITGLRHFSSPAEFLVTAAVLTGFHMLSTNLLFPAVVGRHLRLNAVAVTISLLFWGWMWGAIGLLLAIPIAAAIKVVCDHVQSWQPFGRWLAT